MEWTKRIFSSVIRRPLKNYNVDNRAHKVIEKNEATKPKPAPKHPTTVDYIDKFMKDNPNLLEEQKKKDADLLTRLHGMVVNPDKVGEIQSRPLPVDRRKVEDPIYGFAEPDRIPEGKCSIRQALTFISEYSASPAQVTAQHVADKYKLDLVDVRNVLRYFQMFEIQKPKDPTKYDSIESGTQQEKPSIFKRLTSKSNKEIPGG